MNIIAVGFRYSNRIALGIDDQKRAELALFAAKGKRLTYRQPRVNRLISQGFSAPF